MHVVKIDRIDAEPAQRSLAGAANIGRAVIDDRSGRIRAAHEAEFRRDDDPLPMAGEKTSDEFLIEERTV